MVHENNPIDHVKSDYTILTQLECQIIESNSHQVQVNSGSSVN